MSTLWIREYNNVAAVRPDSGGVMVGAPMPAEPGVDQAISFGAVPGISGAFDAATRFVAITADASFHYVVGVAPVATGGHFRVPVGMVVYVGVGAGQKISAVAAA